MSKRMGKESISNMFQSPGLSWPLVAAVTVVYWVVILAARLRDTPADASWTLQDG